jgi:hypothetical protein
MALSLRCYRIKVLYDSVQGVTRVKMYTDVHKVPICVVEIKAVQVK